MRSASTCCSTSARPGSSRSASALASPSGLPAVVVTTSGTAAAELHPAVLEAHHSGVPMLAVTADRPPELQDSGAPQTVHQVGLYGDAVRWEASPGVPELAAAPVVAVARLAFGARGPRGSTSARAGAPEPGLSRAFARVGGPRARPSGP